jgi:hypothetical protein
MPKTHCMRVLLYTMAYCLLLAGCHKRSAHKLVGEWKLVETGHAGTPWMTVTTAQEQTLILNDDGGYILNTSMLSSFSGCKGTYKLESGVLTLFPECPSTPGYYGPLQVTLDGNTLILDHIITSSAFRSRYIRQ